MGKRQASWQADAGEAREGAQGAGRGEQGRRWVSGKTRARRQRTSRVAGETPSLDQ